MDWVEELITAAEGGSVARVQSLLASSPHGLARQIDDRRPDGVSALMIGSWNGHIEVCELLLAAGADPRLRDSFGNTAFSFATAAADRSRDRVERGRELFKTYAGEEEFPRRYRVLVDAERRQDSINVRVARGRASEKLAAAVGFYVKAGVGDGDGTVWLLDAEVEGARAALAAGAGAGFKVEVVFKQYG